MRLAQRGVNANLQLVANAKGLGVITRQDLYKGQFVCIYAAEIVTKEEAKRREMGYVQAAAADFDAAEEPGDGRCAKGAVESLRALADDVFELQLELLLDGTLVVAVSPAFVGAPLVIVSHASILAGRGRACGDLTTGRPRASGRRASAERKVDRAVTSV